MSRAGAEFEQATGPVPSKSLRLPEEVSLVNRWLTLGSLNLSEGGT